MLWCPAFEPPVKFTGLHQSGMTSHITNSPLLILHFILNNIPSAGSPAVVTHEILKPYLLGNKLRYEEIRFDFTDETTEHLQTVSTLVKDLAK